MKRVAMLAGGAVLLAGALTACAQAPDAGIVIEKGHTDTYVTTVVVNCGKYCAVPVTTVHPEAWKLRLRDAEGDAGWVEVDSLVWEDVEVGDYFEVVE